MNTSLKALAVFIALAGSAWAEDLQDLPDDTLLGEVVTATENGEEERLLDLMREVQARGLLMFPKPQTCTFNYPDTEFFGNEIFRGAVRRRASAAASMISGRSMRLRRNGLAKRRRMQLPAISASFANTVAAIGQM